MMVIVIEKAPPRLRGFLSRLLVEARAGVFLGSYSVRVRERLWKVIEENVKEGNAVMAWSSSNESGFDFCTCGENRREPVDFDGLKLVAFLSERGESRGGT